MRDRSCSGAWSTGRKYIAEKLTLALVVVGALSATLQARPTVEWVTDADGAWNDAANWSSDPQVPGLFDDVVIDRSGAELEVSLSSQEFINSLLLRERLFITGELYSTLGALVDSQITLAGGTLGGIAASSVLTNIGSGSLIVSGFSTLWNVDLGLPTIVQPGGVLNTEGLFSLTAGSSISLGDVGGSGELRAGFISGSGEVVFNGADSRVDASTIGPQITIRSGTRGGTIGKLGDRLVNQGFIRSAASGQTVQVNFGSTFMDEPSINSGTLEAHNGGILELRGGSGTMELSSAGKLLTTNGGEIRLNGGTYTGEGRAPMNETANVVVRSGTLDGMTIGVPLGVRTASATVLNGLTLENAAVSLGDASSRGWLSFSNSQTLNGTGQVVFDGLVGTNQITLAGTNPSLTIGSGITIKTGAANGSVSGGFGRVIVRGNLEASNAKSITLSGVVQFDSSAGLRTLTGGNITLEGVMDFDPDCPIREGWQGNRSPTRAT